MYPEISISTLFSIPTYVVIISITYCICLLWLVRRASQYNLNGIIALDLALILMVSGLIGGRLFHVLYEAPEFYFQHPMEVLKIWKGGFVFYGGALLAFFNGFIFIKWKRESPGIWSDLLAPIASLGYALGRLACLLNGCCYGKHCDLPWSIQGRHPAPAYATIMELGLLALLLKMEKLKRKGHQLPFMAPAGNLFALWVLLHGMARILMESLRDDDRGPFLFNFSISTWISLILIICSLCFLYLNNKSNSSSSSK